MNELNNKVIELGGTISAEHGLGKLKNFYFDKIFSKDQQELFVKIKKFFDPQLKLNIGNIIPKVFLESE